MIRIDNIKISTRLIIGFGLMAVLLFFSSSISLFKAKLLHDDFETVMSEQYPKVVKIEEIRNLLGESELSISHILHYKEKASHDALIEKILLARKQIEGAIAFFNQSHMSEEETLALNDFKSLHTKYVAIQDQYIAQIQDGRPDDALFTMILEMPYVREDYHQALIHIEQIQNNLMNQSVSIAKTSMYSMYTMIGGATVIAMIGAGILALWVIRTITQPILQAVGVAHAVAQGHLTQSIDAQGRSETARLLHSLKQMQSGLVEVVARVRQSSEDIASTSGQITHSNEDLSQRTREQVQALGHTTNSMTQLSGLIHANTESAQQANTFAQKASAIAEQGGQAMQSVVRTMENINSSAQRIVDIISVIDGIAFQTNILALNAAVEAARAGEQGRGFAVVASEVRALAGRSAEAAKEIKDLITSSQERVHAGTQEVCEARRVMSEVVSSIAQAAHIMSEITSASAQQNQDAQQVNKAVMHMEETTQKNAEIVEDMAGAAARLNTQAQELVQIVSVFNLGDYANNSENGSGININSLPNTNNDVFQASGGAQQIGTYSYS